MCLVIDDNFFSFSGGTFVHANNNILEIFQNGTFFERFTTEEKIQWLKVAPDGRTVLVYAKGGTHITRWREGLGIDLFAVNTSKIISFGCGFIIVDGLTITTLHQNGNLRGFLNDGKEIFFSNMESPRSFHPRSFVNLSGNQIAITGFFFSDFAYSAIIIPVEVLLSGKDRFQEEIRSKAPADRAVDLTIGPADSGCFVAFRDPEDTEIPEDKEEEEDLKDVGNFTGVYIRDFNSQKLINKYPYRGKTGTSYPIVATKKIIAIQVKNGVDIIDRISGDTKNISNTILDVAGLQIVKINNKVIEDIVSMNALI
ncbi:MAG: hypothetical protein JST75_02145 [Bacteroidetes bacterium]|nr:hypothetical protein [Bacteroidota bacterium]